MSKLAQPYTCTCGHVVYDTDDAKTVRAGKHQVVICNVCLPKVQAGVQAVARVVGLGLTAFVNKRYPGMLSQLQSVVGIAREAAEQAQGKNHAQG